jgi:hypothetical protein
MKSLPIRRISKRALISNERGEKILRSAQSNTTD